MAQSCPRDCATMRIRPSTWAAPLGRARSTATSGACCSCRVSRETPRLASGRNGVAEQWRRFLTAQRRASNAWARAVSGPNRTSFASTNSFYTSTSIPAKLPSTPSNASLKASRSSCPSENPRNHEHMSAQLGNHLASPRAPSVAAHLLGVLEARAKMADDAPSRINRHRPQPKVDVDGPNLGE